MKIEKLSEENFFVYAIKHYFNPSSLTIEDFMEDLERIKYIKRLLNKFEKKDSLKERLILNHIIILSNVFGNLPSARILFYKLDPEYHSCLKSFLEYLKILPDQIPEVNLKMIPTDHRIDSILKTIR